MKKFFVDHVRPFLFRLAAAFAVMFLFYQIALFYKAKVLSNLAVKVKNASPEEREVVERTNLVYYELSNLVYYILLIIGASISLSILGFSNTTILTILGATGLAMSLALQSYLTAVISGVQVSLNDWYRIGDVIRVQQPNNTVLQGEVVDFDLLRTTLLTDAGATAAIPNDTITKSVIFYLPSPVIINNATPKPT